MKTGYFNTPEKLAQLIYVSRTWQGTPWMANSFIKQVGVSCHNLPLEILIECGKLSKDFPKVHGNPIQSKHLKESVIEKFIDGRAEFESFDPRKEPLRPGDLLGLRIFHCIDHLGIQISENEFTHVLMIKKTSIDRSDVHPWSCRTLKAWRPLL